MPTYKYSKIILTKSGVSLKEPNSADLDYGELAINYKDGKLFFKDDNNVIKTIASGGDLTNLIDHRNDQTSNPHGVTAADVGLGSVDNTPDTDKPLSTDDEAALNRLGTSIIGLSTDDWFLADANPNLGDFTGGIITDNGTIKSALQDLESEVVDGNNNLSTHTSNGANPHSVTAAQLGLGNVENKSSATIRSEIVDSNIPSTITRDSELTAHTGDVTNPHYVTKTQLGLGNVDDKSSATIRSEIVDSNIPSTITRDSELTTHTSNSNNPHGVTAAQLGLVIGTDVQAYSSVLQNTTASYTTAEETKLGNAVEGTGVTNIVSLSQGAYDALTPDATTFYIIV